jgi:hypothetical protein
MKSTIPLMKNIESQMPQAICELNSGEGINRHLLVNYQKLRSSGAQWPSASTGEIMALYAWDDKLVDVSDVIETQKEEFVETALLSAYCYNSIDKKRSYYGVPFTMDVLPNHIWRPLVEKAGHKIEDIPKTWDAHYDFFKEVQKKLRAQGVRNVVRTWSQCDDQRGRPEQRVQLFPDRPMAARGSSRKTANCTSTIRR